MTTVQVQLSFQRLPCLRAECQHLAGSSQGGVQVGRRKPATQGDPAREILAGSPTAGDGWSREFTNGSFVAAKLTEGHRASAAASGKSGCPVWVGCRQ